MGAAVFEMLASLCFDLVFVSRQHTVRHQRRRPDQHGGAQRSHEETSRPAGTELLKEPWCLPSVHSTTETVCRLQVGHRDLEDILRDIDLNGDGHVDFEGEEKPSGNTTAPTDTRSRSFLDARLSSQRPLSTGLALISRREQIYGECVRPISRRRQADREVRG